MGGILRTLLAAFVFFFTATSAYAQWEIEDSHTTASLRGIHNVGGGVAWASGTGGTVLRTTDDGKTWQTCPVPLAGTKDTAEKLDFRGIQAFDAQTAIVMSSGPGDLSRLYKTTDGCQTWKLIFTNPDKDGFWDGLQFLPLDGRDRGRIGHLIGDPVDGKFSDFVSYDYGATWVKSIGKNAWAPSAKPKEALFAASNSSMILVRSRELIVTGGSISRSRVLELHVKHDPYIFSDFIGGLIPVQHSESAGAFSVAVHLGPDSVAQADASKFLDKSIHQGDVVVAVGGDYKQPEQPSGTAAFSIDGTLHWLPAQTPPHGYRSAVAYEEETKTWITIGPNGTDISNDDGRNWRPLTPTPQDAPDADKNWNALSLPFIVGPNGRIGKLRTTALTPAALDSVGSKVPRAAKP